MSLKRRLIQLLILFRILTSASIWPSYEVRVWSEQLKTCINGSLSVIGLCLRKDGSDPHQSVMPELSDNGDDMARLK